VVRPFVIPSRIDNLLLFPVESGTAPIDLSRATKLKDVVFQYDEPQNIDWITKALRTVTPEHRDLQQIFVYMPRQLTHFDAGTDIRQALGESIAQQWLALDRLLIQLWKSHSIRSKVGYEMCGERRNAEYWVGCLLPETTERGIVDLVGYWKWTR